jgi:fermentation-respiration switch protein FrsA (DUF1100 family)
MPNDTPPTVIRIRPTSAAMKDATTDPRFLPADPKNLLVADPSRRTAIRFPSAGLVLAGHLYRPRDVARGKSAPGIAMLGPISSVKEQTLPHYAERFADAGHTVLTFDSRGFGESEGTPRFHYDPNQVIEDYVNAIRFLMSVEGVDPELVVAVGVCMGGGLALSAGAREKRLKGVVSIAGGYDVGGTFQELFGVEGFAAYVRRVNELTTKQYRTGVVEYIPTIAEGLSPEVPVAVMPSPEAYSYYDRTSKAHAPSWSRTMTAASLEPFFAYSAISHAPLVAPTPLLIVHGTTDLVLPPENAQRAYEAARAPKELVWMETHNHIELYDQDPYVSEASRVVLDWLRRHVGP